MVKIDFDGIFVPMITPLNADETLDESGVTRMVEHVLSGGVRGIFLLGTSGEGPALSVETKSQLVRAVCREVRGRVPVGMWRLDLARGTETGQFRVHFSVGISL